MNQVLLALKHFSKISREFMPLCNSLTRTLENLYFGVWTPVFVQKHENVLYFFKL